MFCLVTVAEFFDWPLSWWCHESGSKTVYDWECDLIRAVQMSNDWTTTASTPVAFILQSLGGKVQLELIKDISFILWQILESMKMTWTQMLDCFSQTSVGFKDLLSGVGWSPQGFGVWKSSSGSCEQRGEKRDDFSLCLQFQSWTSQPCQKPLITTHDKVFHFIPRHYIAHVFLTCKNYRKMTQTQKCTFCEITNSVSVIQS